MSKICKFKTSAFSFEGTPLEQARCLLRPVKPLGNVGDSAAVLPAILEELIGASTNISIASLRAFLANESISEKDIGGALSEPLSRTDGDAGPVRQASYFLIHDTSTQLSNKKFKKADVKFPANINTSEWRGNELSQAGDMITHVVINRLGQSRTVRDYRLGRRATKRERLLIAGKPDAALGLFLHHELIQPRLNNTRGIDEFAPDPGFTEAQYERLALCYIAAAVRGGSWLVPCFHGVLDLEILDAHDDPQRFDLDAWVRTLEQLRRRISGAPMIIPSGLDLRSAELRGDPRLERVLDGTDMLVRQPGVQDGVEKVQKALNKLAAKRPQYAIVVGQGVGVFGPKTQTAVLALQRDFALTENGKVDKGTLKTIDDALADGLPRGRRGPATRYKLPAYANAEFGPAAGVPWSAAKPLPGINWHKGLVKNSGHEFTAHDVRAIFYEAMFTIDADGSSGDAQNDPDGQTDTSMHTSDGALNSRKYPFIVLPLAHDDPPGQMMLSLGLKLGDLGVIIFKNGKLLPCLYGDRGPDDQLGEGSMLLAKGLGMSASPTSGGINHREVPPGVVHLVFPGTSDVVGTETKRSAKDVETDAMALFNKFRGRT
jgi:peptidoglycan hydrolase-like protein with peptidoglycan-binding domain